MRQNTSSPRACLPFQCFHTSTGPGRLSNSAVLYVRGANHKRLRICLAMYSALLRTSFSVTAAP